MPFALILAVCGLASRNPTAVMGDRMLERGLPVAGILTVTRHPFLCGAAIWGLTHLAANGDAASVILFGGMSVLAIGGMFAIDRKRAVRLGPVWDEFAAKTSRVPFAAALAGRTRVDWAGVGWLRPAIGLIPTRCCICSTAGCSGFPCSSLELRRTRPRRISRSS